LGWLINEEDLPHPRLAAGTTMLQSKPMRPRRGSIYLQCALAQWLSYWWKILRCGDFIGLFSNLFSYNQVKSMLRLSYDTHMITLALVVGMVGVPFVVALIATKIQSIRNRRIE